MGRSGDGGLFVNKGLGLQHMLLLPEHQLCGNDSSSIDIEPFTEGRLDRFNRSCSHYLCQ